MVFKKKKKHTLIGPALSILLISSKRLRSQSNATPSEDADNIVLKDLDTARCITGERCPKSERFGTRSTTFEEATIVHTDIIQSIPAVTSVVESAKMVVES
jgi:hypothetical protein